MPNLTIVGLKMSMLQINPKSEYTDEDQLEDSEGKNIEEASAPESSKSFSNESSHRDSLRSSTAKNEENKSGKDSNFNDYIR